MTELEKVLMERDGISLKEARDLIDNCRGEIVDGMDPEEAMSEWLGLEPDYLLDIL